MASEECMAISGPRSDSHDSDDSEDNYDHEGEDRRAWGELGRFLLLVSFVIAVFLLGRAMVRNHFFSGGALNHHQGHPTGP
jgi:hypothetical protein